MLLKRLALVCVLLLCCSPAVIACSQAASQSGATPTRVTGKGSLTPTPTPSPTSSGAASDMTPAHFMARILLRGRYRPDDLAFDPAGRLVFSDPHSGTVSRLNADGSVMVLLSGLAAPEGLVYLSDGTLIIAEQQTNRILAYSPTTAALSVLRALPGTPTGAVCKDGVDGIALDPTTQTLIVPDSPEGTVYRMSLDGKKLTLLAAHIPRPVGAAVDTHGNVYVADECGGALWKITPAGAITRIGGFGMLDDVALDREGNLLVTDLKPSIHALIRLRFATGKREVLARQGFIEPQGLEVDAHDDIYVSDDYSDRIVEYVPAP